MINADVQALRVKRDKLAARSDKAFARYIVGDVQSPAYAKRLAAELENVDGDYQRACYAAGVDPVDWSQA